MVALSKTNSIRLEPRQYCALRLFIAQNSNKKKAASKIGISKQLLWKVAESRSGSESTIFTITSVIEPFMENLIAGKILEEISEQWRAVTLDDLESKQARRQSTYVVECKQVACYLMSKHTKLSYLEIASKLGYSDNKMVIYGVDKITEQMELNKSLKTKITAIEESIQSLYK